MQYYSKDNRIVIFGANSMVGSYLLSRLLMEGYTNIHCVVRDLGRCSLIEQVAKRYGIDKVLDKVKLIVGESSNYNFVSSIVESGDVVFNSAAAVCLNDKDKSIIDTNIKIANAIAQSCKLKEVKLVLHVSSVSVLGKNEMGVSTERDVPNSILNKNFYAQSKFYSEGEFWKVHYGGARVIIVNPSVIIGIGNYAGDSSAKIIKTMSKGCLFGSRGVTGWVAAEDVAIAIEKLSQCEAAQGERYIINSQNLEFCEVINMITTKFNKMGVRIYVDGWILSVANSLVKGFKFLKIPFPLSEQTIRGLREKTFYDNLKIKRVIDMEFSPIEKSVEQCVEHFRATRKGRSY